MISFNNYDPHFSNDSIKESFGICDEVINDADVFYYITKDGKLAYIETKAMNKAIDIAKVLYTLGMLNSNRKASHEIQCGTIINHSHLSRLKAETSVIEEQKKKIEDDVDMELKREAMKVLMESIQDLKQKLKDQTESISKLIANL